jgi:hypothetical protein
MPTYSNPALGAPGSVTSIGFTRDAKAAWWGTSEYVIEVRYLNTFSNDPVPSRDTHRTVRTPTGRKRFPHSIEGVVGPEECEVTDQDYVRSAYIVSQAYEMWLIDKTLQQYFDFVRGTTWVYPLLRLASPPCRWLGQVEGWSR